MLARDLKFLGLICFRWKIEFYREKIRCVCVCIPTKYNIITITRILSGLEKIIYYKYRVIPSEY